MEHWAKIAALAEGQPDPSVLRAAFFERIAYIVLDGEDPQDIVVEDTLTGSVVQAIIYNSKIFYYDPDDNTSAHDGVSVIVIGVRRYKTDGTPTLPQSVLAQQNDPPASPSIGDAYLVGTAPTGAWSANAEYVAVYTVRGWEFIAPQMGMVLYVSGSDIFLRYDSAGAWVQGFGVSSLSAASILPSHLLHWAGVWKVENQTTNAPPAVTNGAAYIIGTSPTGAWAGHAGKIAHGQSGSWVIYTPAEGWIAYDKATKTPLAYQSGAWTSLLGALRFYERQFTSGAGSTTSDAGTAYTYNAVTAPTTSNARRLDDVGITRTAAKVGAAMRFFYQFSYDGVPANAPTIAALFRDSDANALDWHAVSVSPVDDDDGALIMFTIASDDLSSHTYKVALLRTADTGVPAAPVRRTFTLEEFF